VAARSAAPGLLALCLGLAGCGRAPAPPAAASAPVGAAPASVASVAATGFAMTITARIHPDLPEMRFTLHADAAPDASGTLFVKAIEIRRDAGPEPVQRITGLDTQTPWSAQAPGFDAVDMNFDGYADIRLVESRPAGPTLPWLHWLYDPASGRFVASPALNELGAPRPDAAARELASDWRDGATRQGTDHHGFRDGQLVPLRREAREYKAAGVYTLTVSRWVNGRWQVVQSRPGRDP
jgi:hypothetical protein